MGKDGQLTIDDFVVASMNQYRNLSDAVIKTMFSHLDADDDGWITAQDACAAATGDVLMTVDQSRICSHMLNEAGECIELCDHMLPDIVAGM